MQLPFFNSTDQTLQLLQTKWRSILNPFITKPMLGGSMLENISITNGTNVINHLLGQTQQGWFVTDINATITLYRSQPFNNKTLTLTASGNAIANIWVY